MSLLGFHRFLIFTAVVFCLGFSIWELAEYRATGNLWGAVLGAGFGLAAVVLGYYLKNLSRILGLSTQPPRGTHDLHTPFSPNGHKSAELEPLEGTTAKDKP